MIGKILTDDNKKLLELIYYYGGYVRSYHLENIFDGLVHSSIWKKLNKLVEMKYLTTRRIKTNSKREPVTYQVTKPTCRLFLNPDSHYRKKHQEEYIYRALIKSYFCFYNHLDLGSIIIADHNKRVLKFEEGEFNKDFFPKKYNKNVPFLHFEEFILDFTNDRGKKLVYNDEVLYDDSMNSLVLMYVDEYYRDVKKQIYFIINRYIDLINSGGKYSINFLIIVDDAAREDLYNSSIVDFINRYSYKEKISNKLIKIYFDYLMKFYGSDDKKEILKAEYIDGKFKKQILDRVSNTYFSSLNERQLSLLNELKLKREIFIVDKVKNYITELGVEESNKLIEQFFLDLFLLEYYNHFNLSSDINQKFDIKVYKIDKKIYE